MTTYAEVMADIDIPLPREPPDDTPAAAQRFPAQQRYRAADDRGADGRAVVVDGARFILDAPAEVDAIWGTGSQVLWAPGEALMIAGPQGVGKTTLAGLLVKALLTGGDVLGLPAAPYRGRVLYLAMDRPRQIARSLRRQFSEEHRELLADRLVVRPGPLPADVAAQPLLLAGLAEEYGAGVLFVDSLKDAAVGLTDDAVAASYNRARQHLLATGCQVAELHHVIKRTSRGDHPAAAVDAIYGSTWLTSGAGSIVMLIGEPGDPIVSFRHVKQPAEEVGPFRLLHDQTAGLLTVEHSVDLPTLVDASGPDGLTARAAAAAIGETSKPSRAEVEKARRKLDALTAAGVLSRLEGGRGGTGERAPSVYFRAVGGNHGQSRSEVKPQVSTNHGLFDPEDLHGNHAPITPESETAGQDYHATNHADHTAINHETHPPL